MKRLFRPSQSPKKAQKIVFTLSFLLFIAGIFTANLAQDKSDRSLREQEDQLIRQFDLPSTPSRTPVYRPKPQQAPAKQDPTSRPPRRQAEPSRPRRRAAEAPAARPQRQQQQEAPAPRRRRPAPVQQEAPAPRQRRQVPQVPVAVPDDSPAPRPRRSQATPASPTTRSRTTEEAETKKLQAELDKIPSSQYVMEFNRSPIVGNSLRLRGTYGVGRVAFTRPRGWKIRGARAVIRFQHSPALFANRSNLTVLVNGKGIGSIALNRKPNQIGQAVLNIPPNLIQDFNVINLVAQQNNTQNCSDPGDATLWTEILPDSKLIFSYQPQPIPLNFSNYPYPFFDDLALDTNRIVYLQPNQVNQAWLTASGRLNTAFGRLADFRPMTTDLVQAINQVEANERLAIIGTPSEQPALASLDLPVPVSGNQILDRNRNPLPEDVGVLMLTTNDDGSVPILVATGNGAEGVAKAVQFLTQPDVKKMGTGQVILVDKLKDVPSPSPRKWPRFLPEKNSFKLSDIKKDPTDKPVKDITIRGSNAQPVEFDFRGLPDDRFLRGSSMNLVYSYGPQANPRTSAVEVLLDGVFIGGARLTSESGESRKNLRVDLPANLIKPNSKIEIYFRLNSKEPFDKQKCILPPIEQLSGTVHAEETTFDLKRETSVQLPDLELMQFGFPFAAPQDLSTTAVVVPEKPTDTDILTMLAFSERLGRLSQSDSVKLNVYQANELPEEAKKAQNLVGIGVRQKFPFPELTNSKGFNIGEAFSRSTADSSIQTLPDGEGMIKQIMSPWNGNRVLLALTAQTDAGLDRVRQIILKDPWFFQIRDDTVLISSNQQEPAAYDPDAYRLDFFRNAPERRRVEETNPLSKASRFLQDNWVLLPVGILGLGLLLYGVSQIYLKRTNVQDKK
ncbi:MAG: cellulose biosynthesis cyclic di-GMP-binding regulatory protein BcsB [Nostocaceae cyanobacterium]|nr:cellulose biosynthesis cyclic di-GMP-binding regulatory protein BcsB [Nostocaceae cyanobacterium]